MCMGVHTHTLAHVGMRLFNEELFSNIDTKPTAVTCSDTVTDNVVYNASRCLSQWPRGVRRRSSAAHLQRIWVRIPPGAWMFVCCECCVLSGRGPCDGLITRPEESYRLWRVIVCDQETLKMRKLKPATGL